MRTLLGAMAVLLLSGCTGEKSEASENGPAKVDASGKIGVPLNRIPAGVLGAVKMRAPDLKLTEAETETRNSVRYYDLAGKNADGSEMELDVMQDGTSWKVVETQRDLAFAAVPAPVQSAARTREAGLSPNRVIESRQEDGLVIYELYSPQGSNPQGKKMEIRWDGKQAEVLASEWVH